MHSTCYGWLRFWSPHFPLSPQPPDDCHLPTAYIYITETGPQILEKKPGYSRSLPPVEEASCPIIHSNTGYLRLCNDRGPSSLWCGGIASFIVNKTLWPFRSSWSKVKSQTLVLAQCHIIARISVVMDLDTGLQDWIGVKRRGRKWLASKRQRQRLERAWIDSKKTQWTSFQPRSSCACAVGARDCIEISNYSRFAVPRRCYEAIVIAMDGCVTSKLRLCKSASIPISIGTWIEVHGMLMIHCWSIKYVLSVQL